MTVKHLFTMSAGLDYTLDRPAVQQIIRENPDASTVEVVNTFVKEPLLFVPGDQFEYSLCHDVLGAVIEVAAQKTLGAVSYTHLDVYKRQVRAWISRPKNWNCCIFLHPTIITCLRVISCWIRFGDLIIWATPEPLTCM